MFCELIFYPKTDVKQWRWHCVVGGPVPNDTFLLFAKS
jgi:hypothetical protein